MPYVHPDREQFAALLALDTDDPIHMLNLLRFHAIAQYADAQDLDKSGAGPCRGIDAYARYSKAVRPLLEKAGGQVVANWVPQLTVIGPQDLSWDQAFVVRYPSKQAFLGMINEDAYKAAALHRTAALADSRLILMRDEA